MKDISLADFVAKHGQARTGLMIGMTQGGVSQALRHNRKIFVVEDGNGKVSAYEIKPIGKQEDAA